MRSKKRLQKILLLVIFIMNCSEIKPQEKMEIPGIGIFHSFSYGSSTWEGDDCSITISADGTIATHNSCWSGMQCDYKKGSHQGKVSAASIKKFVELLGEKNMLYPMPEQEEDDETSHKRNYSHNIINTSKGKYGLNIIEASDRVRDLIWQMRCEAGIEDSVSLIGNKLHFSKIVYYYPNQKDDYSSYFTLSSDGQCWYSEITGNSQSTGSTENFTSEEMELIIKVLKSDKSILKKPVSSFDESMALKNKKHYKLIYTNKGIFELEDKQTLDTLLTAFKKKKK